jgi:hypothetical protein
VITEQKKKKLITPARECREFRVGSFDFSPVGHQRLGEGFQGLSAAAFNHQEKFMSLRVEHIAHVAMASPGTGLVNRDRSHLPPRVLGVGRFNIMGRHAPKPGIVLAQSVGNGRHRHLSAQQQSQGLKKKRETAALPRPGYRYVQHSVFRAIAARHPRFQEALVLEEVQMPPTFGAGVMDRAKLAALRTSKALALLEIQLQEQSAPVRLQIDIPLLSIPLRVARPPIQKDQILGANCQQNGYGELSGGLCVGPFKPPFPGPQLV